MNIKFCGAARCVTGSCHKIGFEGGKLLVDCGMRQGADEKGPLGADGFAFDPTEISAVLLTHAHIDHSGLLPLLIKRGYKGKIFATKATAELSGIMLPDSAHIQEQDAEYQTKKNLRAGKKPVLPMYTSKDAQAALERFEPVNYGDIVEIMPGVRARFSDVGHLLGSAAIELWVEEQGKTTKFVFSGDIGRNERPILRDPAMIQGADYLVVEGTYGDRDHDVVTQQAKEDQLLGVLKAGLKRGGNIVIPSFAVGRTQELIYTIKRLIARNALPGLEKVPVFVDSPLGISATKIYERCAREYYDDEALEMLKQGSPFDLPMLHVTQTSDESKLINAQPGCNIIIASSGMCNAGRIRHHLKHNLYRADSTVVFAGYQANGTLGRMLTDGVKTVKLFGENIHVNAAVSRVDGFSGHAGKSELLGWINAVGRKQKPKCVFLVHGESKVLDVYSKDVQSLGFETAIPSLGDKFDLQAESTAAAALPGLTPRVNEKPELFIGKKLGLAAEKWNINGAFYAMRGEDMLYNTAMGIANIYNSKLNTIHTKFALGGASRLFYAAAALKLGLDVQSGGEQIEKAAGKPLGIALYEQVFKPLGLKETAYGIEPETTYFRAEGAAVSIGETGVVTTAYDLARFGDAIITDKLFGVEQSKKLAAYMEHFGPWDSVMAEPGTGLSCLFVNREYGISFAILENAPEDPQHQDELGAESFLERVLKELDGVYDLGSAPTATETAAMKAASALSKAVEQLKNSGITGLKVSLNVGDEKAAALYKLLGFEVENGNGENGDGRIELKLDI